MPLTCTKLPLVFEIFGLYIYECLVKTFLRNGVNTQIRFLIIFGLCIDMNVYLASENKH